MDPKGIEPFFILVKSQEQRQILLRILCVRPKGLEPLTFPLKVEHSSHLSYERIEYVLIKARNFKMQTS